MTGTAPAVDLAALWRQLPPDRQAALLEAMPDDEIRALEIALGPDPSAIDQARADTADPLAWIAEHLPALMPLEPGPHHRAIADALPADRPTGIRAVFGAPRGSGKSTLALSALPIVAAVRRSHRFVVVIRDNLPDAVTSVRGIRQLLEATPDLTGRYPWVAPLPGEAGELHLEGGTVIVARSTGSAIRGLNRTLADGSIVRPDLVVGDDLEDDDSARSSLQTGRLQEWILGTVGQLGGPPGSGDAALDLLVVGTTLETGALVSRMLDGTGPFASWHRARYPAEVRVEIRDGDPVAVDTDSQPVPIPVDPDVEAGARLALWPAGMPLDYLDRLTDPADSLFVGSVLYAREYLLRPRQRSDVLFAAANTRWASIAERWLAGDLVVERAALGADPAVSTREVADYTALAVTGLVRAGDLFDAGELAEFGMPADRQVLVVPWADRRRGTPGEILTWVEESAGLWIPNGRVAFEAEGGFAAMYDELRRRGQVRGRPVDAGGKDKRTRAVPMSVWHEAGRVVFDEALRGGPMDLELHGFTGTGQEEHDDMVDGLVYAATYSTNAWRRR